LEQCKDLLGSGDKILLADYLQQEEQIQVVQILQVREAVIRVNNLLVLLLPILRRLSNKLPPRKLRLRHRPRLQSNRPLNSNRLLLLNLLLLHNQVSNILYSMQQSYLGLGPRFTREICEKWVDGNAIRVREEKRRCKTELTMGKDLASS